MSIKESISKLTIAQIFAKYSFVNSWFSNTQLNVSGSEDVTIKEYIDELDYEDREDRALDSESILESLSTYIEQMLAFLGNDTSRDVESITILPGTNKSGEAEGYEELTIKKGDIIAIVGPTGSGKSRLLGDIEWMAQGDTPTSRKILINGKVPDSKWRFSSSDKLVAQLSQNMNFVMDLSVEEFITLHAESRMVNNIESIVEAVITEANELAGEKFASDTAITSLSGGQSRALMIADTAILSSSPIVLIDVIENAGIDRKKALSLLLKEDKVVLMATHDPMLALLGDRRIVISNGGISSVINTDDKERAILHDIEKLDKKVQEMRELVRYGKRLDSFEF